MKQVNNVLWLSLAGSALGAGLGWFIGLRFYLSWSEIYSFYQFINQDLHWSLIAILLFLAVLLTVVFYRLEGKNNWGGLLKRSFGNAIVFIIWAIIGYSAVMLAGIEKDDYIKQFNTFARDHPGVHLEVPGISLPEETGRFQFVSNVEKHSGYVLIFVQDGEAIDASTFSREFFVVNKELLIDVINGFSSSSDLIRDYLDSGLRLSHYIESHMTDKTREDVDALVLANFLRLRWKWGIFGDWLKYRGFCSEILQLIDREIRNDKSRDKKDIGPTPANDVPQKKQKKIRVTTTSKKPVVHGTKLHSSVDSAIKPVPDILKGYEPLTKATIKRLIPGKLRNKTLKVLILFEGLIEKMNAENVHDTDVVASAILRAFSSGGIENLTVLTWESRRKILLEHASSSTPSFQTNKKKPLSTADYLLDFKLDSIEREDELILYITSSLYGPGGTEKNVCFYLKLPEHFINVRRLEGLGFSAHPDPENAKNIAGSIAELCLTYEIVKHFSKALVEGGEIMNPEYEKKVELKVKAYISGNILLCAREKDLGRQGKWYRVKYYLDLTEKVKKDIQRHVFSLTTGSE